MNIKNRLILLGILFISTPIIGLLAFRLSYKKYEDDNGIYYNPLSLKSDKRDEEKYSISKKSMNVYIFFFLVGISLFLILFILNLIIILIRGKNFGKKAKTYELV